MNRRKKCRVVGECRIDIPLHTKFKLKSQYVEWCEIIVVIVDSFSIIGCLTKRRFCHRVANLINMINSTLHLSLSLSASASPPSLYRKMFLREHRNQETTMPQTLCYFHYSFTISQLQQTLILFL